MKIVNIIGGLGNQMFQYALYLALRQQHPDEQLRIHLGAFRGYPLHNAYELPTVFGANAPIATAKEVVRLAYPYLHYRLWQVGNHLLPARRTMLKENTFGQYDEAVLQREGDCFYDGYWQNEQYFAHLRNTLLKTYTPLTVDSRNVDVARTLAATNSVSIHVRRGDYLNKPLYQGICDIDYYRTAVSDILRTTRVDTFCILTNDIPWSREHIVPLLNGTRCILPDWNTGTKSYLDMYLMTQCRHNIIAHSTFSWWGAWLNTHPDRIVIAPSRWNNLPNARFSLPEGWRTVTNA